jgi:hypothetical protein
MHTAIMALASLMLAARAVSVSADVIHVPTDQPTIQAAINAAVDGDEVVIAPGTYNEAINFSGKAITVRGEAGPDVTTIDATGLGQVSVVRFGQGEGPDSVLQDLTITGGAGRLDASGDPVGGGIYAGGNPTIINCRIEGNQAVRLDLPASTARGGGIYHAGIQGMLLLNCRISDNLATAVSAYGGGAVLNTNSMMINCEITGNEATGWGEEDKFGSMGGVAWGAGVVAASNVALINCTIAGNVATGIGVIFDGGTARGGGIAMTNGGTLINCTIASNIVTATGFSSSAAGGGVFASNAPTALANCIVALNSLQDKFGRTVMQNISGTVTAQHSCVNVPGGGGLPGEGNIDANPMFEGGSSNLRLQGGSPCRDAGSNDALPLDTHDLDGDGNTTEQLSRDLDLLRRKVNGIVDMGAYEWQHACASDIAPSSPGVAGDGVVDVDDLVAVILGWGACDQCVADIDGDDQVNVDDLVLVILSWGPCS